MNLVSQIRKAAEQAVKELYPDIDDTGLLTVHSTREGFRGDYSLVLFPLAKKMGTSPQEIGEVLGRYLKEHSRLIGHYETVSGFLNLEIAAECWKDFLLNQVGNPEFGQQPRQDWRVMVEFSSPNTNKPLHFGHLRNIFLGDALSRILKANGMQVIKSTLINDRGIHICKSMLAWKKFANGATPQSTGIKGDHLVGDYYVRFNQEYQKEVEALVQQGKTKEEAEKQAPLLLEAQAMLRQWEEGDPETLRLWETMNQWVYDGFDQTYAQLGIQFDKQYFESKTYLLGKSLVEKGLEKNIVYRKEDGSLWINLEDQGLDHKLLLRGDGTSVYITQDLGTAREKHENYQLDQSIYVIGDEQNHHMQVLKAILHKLGEPSAPGIHHLSYGMVELPSGRMKSREGTVVDADQMIEEMVTIAREQTEASGKTGGLSAEELDQLCQTIGLGALKFYLLRVDPKKKMIFNPKESIDLQGFTASFIQYAHARICSIMAKAGHSPESWASLPPPIFQAEDLDGGEKAMLRTLEFYPEQLRESARDMNPSLLAQYAFRLTQQFNSFYDTHPILKAESETKKGIRMAIIRMTAQVLRHAMALLGIALPRKM